MAGQTQAQGHITAIELQRASSRRMLRSVEGHNVILTRCYSKIKRVAGIDGTSCIFEVPEFVIGVPPYEMCKAVSHVISSLERNGYEVTYMFPRSLLISWDLEGTRTDPPRMSPVTLGSPANPIVSNSPIAYRPISDFKPTRRFVLPQ